MGMANVGHCRRGQTCRVPNGKSHVFEACDCNCDECCRMRLQNSLGCTPGYSELMDGIREYFKRFDAPEGGPWCPEAERISMQLRAWANVPIPSGVRNRVRSNDEHLARLREQQETAKRCEAERAAAVLEFERSG